VVTNPPKNGSSNSAHPISLRKQKNPGSGTSQPCQTPHSRQGVHQVIRGVCRPDEGYRNDELCIEEGVQKKRSQRDPDSQERGVVKKRCGVNTADEIKVRAGAKLLASKTDNAGYLIVSTALSRKKEKQNDEHTKK